MPSALAIVGALTILAVGGSATWVYDRHEPVSWHTRVLFWHPGIDIPPGPLVAAERARDAALAASRMAQDGQKRCDASLDVQTKSLALAAEKGDKALTLAQTALDANKATNARLRSAAASLAAFPAMAGETACARWDRADGAVLAALMMGVR